MLRIHLATNSWRFARLLLIALVSGLFFTPNTYAEVYGGNTTDLDLHFGPQTSVVSGDPGGGLNYDGDGFVGGSGMGIGDIGSKVAPSSIKPTVFYSTRGIPGCPIIIAKCRNPFSIPEYCGSTYRSLNYVWLEMGGIK